MLLISVKIIDVLLFVDQFSAFTIPGESSVPNLLIFSLMLTTQELFSNIGFVGANEILHLKKQHEQK